MSRRSSRTPRARRVAILRVVAVIASLLAIVGFASGAVRHSIIFVIYLPVAWILRWSGSRYGTGDAFYRVAGVWWTIGGIAGIVAAIAFPMPDAGSITGSALTDGLWAFGCATLAGVILLSMRASDIEKGDGGPTSIFTAR